MQSLGLSTSENSKPIVAPAQPSKYADIQGGLSEEEAMERTLRESVAEYNETQPMLMPILLARNNVQCSVCQNLPECNIYHCNKSDLHLTCQDCLEKLKKPRKCPTCKDKFPARPKRSRMAEQVYNKRYQI